MSLDEIDCLCGARENDIGQTIPCKCWNCSKNTMGIFTARGMAAAKPARQLVGSTEGNSPVPEGNAP